VSEQHLPDEGQVSFETDVEGEADSERATAPSAEEVDLSTAVAALTNDLQRLQAEYVNYKRRVDRDRELVLQNARFAVLASLLPVLGAVDRARLHGELEGGFKAVAESLERIVAAQGMVKFGATGDAFDPHLHEALMHHHSPDVTTTTCGDVIAAGYRIGERVVRPAQVVAVDPETPSVPEPEVEPDLEVEPDPEREPDEPGD